MRATMIYLNHRGKYLIKLKGSGIVANTVLIEIENKFTEQKYYVHECEMTKDIVNLYTLGSRGLRHAKTISHGFLMYDYIVVQKVVIVD